MGFLLFLLILALPVAELWFLFRVADWIGFLPALALLVAVSIAGAWLLKREGMATWRRMQETLRQGRMPAQEVTDGALILLGGALLLTPGFLTDIVGLLFVFPVTRAVLKVIFRRLLGGYALQRAEAVGYVGSSGKRVYDARVVDKQRRAEGGAPEITAGSPAPEDPYPPV